MENALKDMEKQFSLLELAASGHIDKIQNRWKGIKNPTWSVDKNQLIESFKSKRAEMGRIGQMIVTTSTTASSLEKDSSLSKDWDQLESILAEDLIVENIHYGSVFIGRVVAPAHKTNAISILIEDQSRYGDPLIVAVYNYVLPSGRNLVSQLDSVFPVGTLLAIKEPYLKVSASGGLIVRIDEPEEIQVIEDPNFPHLTNESWKKPLIASLPKDIDGEDGWRVRGNIYYTNGNFERALKFYNFGLALDPSHSILLLNKLAALIALKRYSEIIPIAIPLLPILNQNEKLYSRLGKAYYHVGLYEKSIETYQQLLQFSPSNPEASGCIKNCQDRLLEKSTGQYNLKSLRDKFNSTKEVDCSEYIGPIKIAKIEKKGRGLVASKDIPVGTLLIVSKGVGVYQEKEKPNEVLYNVNFKGKNASDLSSTQIVSLTNQVVKRDPHISHQISKLYSGPKSSVLKEVMELNDFVVKESQFTQQEFKKPSVDQIRNIVKYNAFKIDDSLKHGLWILPSLINHSCVSNCTRFNIGETMFIYSTKNLKENEEMVMAYLPSVESYELRKETLLSFDIECSCQLCTLDKAVPTTVMNERKRLTETFKKTLSPKIKKFDCRIIPTLEKHIESMKKTYPPNQLIRNDLFLPVAGIALLYKESFSIEKALKTYLECVKISGFMIEFDYSKAKLSPEKINFVVKCEGYLSPETVDTFMNISTSSSILGYETSARKFLALSRLTGLVFKGFTFEEHRKYLEKFHKRDLFKFNDTIQLININS